MHCPVNFIHDSVYTIYRVRDSVVTAHGYWPGIDVLVEAEDLDPDRLSLLAQATS